MLIRYRFAAASFALAAALLLVRPAVAGTILVDCTVDNGTNNVIGYLQSVLTQFGSATYEVIGTCIGDIVVPANSTIEAEEVGDATIRGQVRFGGTNVTLSGLIISGAALTSTEAVIVFGNTFVILSNCTIEFWTGTTGGAAVSVFEGGTVEIVGGSIEDNGNGGLDVSDGGVAELGTNNDTGASAAVTIENNTLEDGNVLHAAGGIEVSNARVDIENAIIQGNQGNAVTATLGEVEFENGTIAAASGSGLPAIQLYRSGLVVSGTVTGPGDAPTILASSNSTVLLQGGTISDSDASANDGVLFLEDGSAAHSNGGNTITNSASGGIAVKVTNGSTFHQRIEAASGSPAGADTITGKGEAQIESNIELGTGTTPSTWTGSISIAQNSSFRMDGGMTVNGAVTLAQSSNGFFNLNNTGSKNVVTGSVSCIGTAQTAHVAAATGSVLTSSGGTTSAVTASCPGF